MKTLLYFMVIMVLLTSVCKADTHLVLAKKIGLSIHRELIFDPSMAGRSMANVWVVTPDNLPRNFILKISVEKGQGAKISGSKGWRMINQLETSILGNKSFTLKISKSANFLIVESYDKKNKKLSKDFGALYKTSFYFVE